MHLLILDSLGGFNIYKLIVTIKQRKNSSQIAQRIKIIIELYASFD